MQYLHMAHEICIECVYMMDNWKSVCVNVEHLSYKCSSTLQLELLFFALCVLWFLLYRTLCCFSCVLLCGICVFKLEFFYDIYVPLY